MKGKFLIITMLLCLSRIAMGETSDSYNRADPPDKTVRVFLVLPNDVPLDSAYVKGISKVMKSSQRYFMEQCKYTFKLNNPICEVIKGTHPTSWYITPDDYWTIVFNGTDDMYSILPNVKADASRSRWKIVVYVVAESPADGGGGGGGWVGLPKHDADGAKGYPKDTARWCGGMCHELGHCFGLDDATSTDGTVMSASFYGWPNCIFNSGHISSMKNLAANSGFWTDKITETVDEVKKTIARPSQWDARIENEQLHIMFNVNLVSSMNVILYDLEGRQVARFSNPSILKEKRAVLFDLHHLKAGAYLCSVKIGDATSIQKIIKKD